MNLIINMEDKDERFMFTDEQRTLADYGCGKFMSMPLYISEVTLGCKRDCMSVNMDGRWECGFLALMILCEWDRT